MNYRFLVAADFTVKIKIPLNPPLIKGDFFNPPFLKGGRGIFYQPQIFRLLILGLWPENKRAQAPRLCSLLIMPAM